jgi:hypothetical protein
LWVIRIGGGEEEVGEGEKKRRMRCRELNAISTERTHVVMTNDWAAQV